MFLFYELFIPFFLYIFYTFRCLLWRLREELYQKFATWLINSVYQLSLISHLEWLLYLLQILVIHFTSWLIHEWSIQRVVLSTSWPDHALTEQELVCQQIVQLLSRLLYLDNSDGNSADKLRHHRSVANLVELMLLNKCQFSSGGARLDCYSDCRYVPFWRVRPKIRPSSLKPSQTRVRNDVEFLEGKITLSERHHISTQTFCYGSSL